MNQDVKLKDIQNKNLLNDSIFFAAYKKLFLGKYEDLSEDDLFLLLKFAVIFSNTDDYHLKKLGYKIILRYSNLSNNYIPLYDISINYNYIPVSKFIEKKYLSKYSFNDGFYNLFISASCDYFKKEKGNKAIYLSEGQKRLDAFSKKEEDFIIVAPTSYGKSEIIISKVEDNIGKNICIIVPTKSLLAQTKRNLTKNVKIRNSKSRVITHPDMYSESANGFIAVLTQERLLRLLQKHPKLIFNVVLIDEAHNMIDIDSRETLTVQDLHILKNRNSLTKFYYFTPFLSQPENIKIFSSDDNLVVENINEFIKVEKYFYSDLTANDKKLCIYDQFFNIAFESKEQVNVGEFDFINQHGATKNIIYLNRPIDIESFSLSIKNPIKIDAEIKKAQEALRDFLHKDYNLIKTIENGVVYHHGSMPENVRMYVEDIFSRINNIKYIVTTSTLLQGVNIPAEKIFLLSSAKGRKSLNPSQFKNLTGRVCRFSEVFDNFSGNLNMLEPEVYVLKSRYSSKKFNPENFLMKSVRENKIIKDKIENPLIKQNTSELNDLEKQNLNESLEYLINIEPEIITDKDVRIVKSEIAKLCFKNNVYDFDIYDNESVINKNYDDNKERTNINDPEELLSVIFDIFIKNVSLRQKELYNKEKAFSEKNISRLGDEKTRRFYAMFLSWKMNSAPYRMMIGKIISYWNKLERGKRKIYVGSTWGDCKMNDSDFRNNYVDLDKKTESAIVNLAIVRIKEEQDYIDYFIIKYVEILNDLGFLNKTFYEKIKYGTDDQNLIMMLKEGFSMELAKKMKEEKYFKYINIVDGHISVDYNIVEDMRSNKENDILIFEIQFFTNK